MKQSFISPRPKPFLSLFSRLWILFIVLVALLIVGFSGYISLDISSLKQGIVSLNEQRESLEGRIDEHDETISLILRQKALAEEIFSSNILLKESMKNLFDLVPDQITLHRVEMERNSLILYGTTPTQDSFNFLLSAPLKSIFHTSQTNFYLTPQGWYNFVSINRIIPEDGVRE